METVRESVWKAMLQSDQEQRYWHAKACQYVKWDFRAKLFLAIVTSSSVASWSIWIESAILWKSLTVGASLLSIVLPILSLNDKVLAMTEVHAKWLQLMHDYEGMWRDQDTLEQPEVRSRLDAAKRIESELSSKTINLPGKDIKLGGETFHQVKRDRNL